MLNAFNPPGMAAPIGAYSHGVEAPAGARFLHVAGQVGNRPDGTIPPTCAEQAECAWRNIVTILEASGLTVADIVHVRTYVTKPEDFAVHPAVRAKYLGTYRPASTGLCISALAKPEFLIEIEVVAARA